MRAALYSVFDLLCLAYGAGVYWRTGSTPQLAHQALVRMFCRTGGRSNDLLAQWARRSDPGPRLPEPHGEFGVADGADVQRIVERLRADGYCVLEKRLPDAACDRLLAFALDTPGAVRPMTGQPAGAGPALRTRYERSKPLAVRYDFDTGDVLGLREVQALLTNLALLSIARAYLRTTPVADVLSMWWHTAYSSQPDEEAAQFYHFDLDRIQWLKIFIYLTDVGPESGPHCFVRGSHRTHGIPRELLAKGYARLTDEEVFRHYRRDQAVEFLAPRGTVLIEDSRGLHKGREVLKGDRLMLQIQFSNSLFGGSYPPARPRAVSSEFAAMARSFPEIYANYFDGTS